MISDFVIIKMLDLVDLYSNYLKIKSNCEKARMATGHPEQGGDGEGSVVDPGKHLLQLSPPAPAARLPTPT